MIFPAKKSDAKLLTEVALQSKAFWGYSDELIESWRNDLMVTENAIATTNIFKYKIDTKIAGFYFLNPPKKNYIVLEMLFVAPEFIGKGIGKQLLHHAIKKATECNASIMSLLADPNAVPFYKSQGFICVDKKESTIAGRFLPIMQKDLRR